MTSDRKGDKSGKVGAGEDVEEEEVLSEPWAHYQRQIYITREPPVLTVNVQKLQELAKAKLKPEAYDYVACSAGQNRTYHANLDAFDRYRLKPNMLVAANQRNTSVTLFGRKLPAPLLLAPIGVQGIVHPDAEEASARAAAELNIPYIMSTAATRSIEAVAEASGPNAPRWFQLYWPLEDDVTQSVLRRAQNSGFQVLVVTLDTVTIGYRPADLDRSYLPFLEGLGCQIGFSDPVFMERLGKLHHLHKPLAEIPPDDLFEMSVASLGMFNSGTYRPWADLAKLKAWWNGPIVLKGIQTVADAHQAIAAGCEGIVVSNHGGRQVDGAIASLDALKVIAADDMVKRSGVTILFDSGIRTGSDMIKALALGAKACLLGRPYIYGLGLAGQEGVEHVVKSILAEFDLTLGLAGYVSVDNLNPSMLEEVGRSKL